MALNAPLPAESARTLLSDFRASLLRDPDHLPPYSSKLVREVTDEMMHTHNKLSSLAEEVQGVRDTERSIALSAAAEIYWQYMTFAKRALCTYMMARRNVLTRMAWDPQQSAASLHGTGNVSDAAFFQSYRDALARLGDSLPGEGLIELTSYAKPPSNEMVRVVALRSVSDVLTEDGEVSLVGGATLMLRAPVAESLVKMGYCVVAEQ